MSSEHHQICVIGGGENLVDYVACPHETLGSRARHGFEVPGQSVEAALTEKSVAARVNLIELICNHRCRVGNRKATKVRAAALPRHLAVISDIPTSAGRQ